MSYIKLNKADYYIHEFIGGYYGICTDATGAGCIFGGDSANHDDYDLELFTYVYDNWNGYVREENGDYRIDTEFSNQSYLSSVIVDFFASHPAISVNHVETEIGLPAGTLRQAVGGYRLIPEKHIWSVITYLIPYGFTIWGYTLTYDPADDTITGRKWVRNGKVIEKDNSFEYHVVEYRLLLGGYFDLIMPM